MSRFEVLLVIVFGRNTLKSNNYQNQKLIGVCRHCMKGIERFNLSLDIIVKKLNFGSYKK